MFVPAAATVVSYICTVSFYFLCVAQSIDVPDLTGYLGLNAATISGVVLSATFLVAAVVLSAVSRGTNKDIKSYIFNSVFRGGYSALLFIVLGLIGFGFVFFGLNSYSGSNASYGILALFNNLAVSVGYNAEYIQKIYNMCAIFAGVARCGGSCFRCVCRIYRIKLCFGYRRQGKKQDFGAYDCGWRLHNGNWCNDVGCYDCVYV